MKYLLGALSALVAIAAAVLAIIWTGLYNIAATDKHADPVRWALAAAMANSVERRAEQKPPQDFTEQDVRRGFSSFDAMCVQCHGAPGVQRTEWAAGMRPQPPELSEHVPDWTTEELFWIIKHGIKMTGMPALGPTHEDSELWEIVAFLEQLPELDAQAYAALRQTVSSGHHADSGERGGDKNTGAEPGHHSGGSEPAHGE